MKNQLSKIKRTLEGPDEVRKSDKDSQVHLYFKKFEDSPVTEKYLLAVVRIETEYPVPDEIKSVEKLPQTSVGKSDKKI